MENYFRITAYHPKENISAIIDSNGQFEKIWQFSSSLVNKGFKILKVNNEFQEGDFSKINKPTTYAVRAYAVGMPDIKDDKITINNKSYYAS